MVKKGLVIKSTGSWFSVLDGGRIVQCRIKGKFRLKDIKTTNPVTVGDTVNFEQLEDGNGIIVSIHERKNYIIRKATSFHKEAHLLASNIDVAFLMTTLKFPETQPEFIDRFLLTAEAYHIESIILVNKIDLLNKVDGIQLEEFIRTYRLAGYRCILMSLQSGIGVPEVKSLMQGKINLIAGNSGVGKTSLINFLVPALDLKTDEISDSHHSGKHTTTFSELFTLNENTYVIDSPGIRGFGLIDLSKEEIGLYFPEIFRISKACKFYNCTHIHEPDCAVKEAVAMHQIGETRYKSYVNIISEEKTKYR
jgi:ribosome biogenesis GTPase / thiamine phosphate phosphatase